MKKSELMEKRIDLCNDYLEIAYAQSINAHFEDEEIPDIEERIEFVPVNNNHENAIQPENSQTKKEPMQKTSINTTRHNDTKPSYADLTLLDERGIYPELYDYEYRRFNESLLNCTLKEIDEMDGNSFAEYIAYILETDGFSCYLSKKSYDYGVDIIAKNEYITLGVQCKISNSEPLDNHAIQEIVAGVGYYNLDKGMVVTNSTFHKRAIQLSEKNHIVLWDRKKLYKKILESKHKEQAYYEGE